MDAKTKEIFLTLVEEIEALRMQVAALAQTIAAAEGGPPDQSASRVNYASALVAMKVTKQDQLRYDELRRRIESL